MERRKGSPWVWVRAALATFVLVWILGPSELRGTVPILVVFLIALGLEVHFLVGALRGGARQPPDRSPQAIDRDRYGFELEAEFDERELDAGGADLAHVSGPAPYVAAVRRFALGLGVIAALVATIWIVQSRTGWSSVPGDRRAEAVGRFSEDVSSIAQKQVSVRCDEARDYVGAVQHADGVATVGGDLAILTPEICHVLYRLAFDGEVTGSRTGRAIAVLAHEAWHLRGVGDEATAECYALQSGVALGVRLGLSEGTARQLMRQQFTENALRGVGSFEYRVSSECRDGARLDLDPDDTTFP